MLSKSDEEQFMEFKRAGRLKEARANATKMESDCLSPYTDKSILKDMCARSRLLGVGGVVVLPYAVRLCRGYLGDDGVTEVIAEISYPHGGDLTEIKCAAVKRAVRCGADEVEVCAPTAHILEGNLSYFKRECKKLKKSSKTRALRISLDCSALCGDTLFRAVDVAAESGVDLLRLCGADGELLSKVKARLCGRSGVKADKAETCASFINFCMMGADAVNCSAACDFAAYILKRAEEE